MAKGRKDSESNVAYCADYDSSNEEEVQNTKKIASANAYANANSGAKRSSGALVTGGGTETAPVHNVDLASDSGYSSRTQATSASADSIASIRAKTALEQALAAQDFAAATAGPSIQRIAQDGETASQRSGSSTSTKTKKRVVQCAQPNCAKCVEARARLARKAKPKVRINTNVSPVKSREESPDKRSITTVRPSPAIIQSAQPRRRDSQQGPRPNSMYAGSAPPSFYHNRSGYSQPANPGAVMVVERPGAVMSARGGARGGPRSGPVQYDPQAGHRFSARRVMKPTVVQADAEGEKMRRQLAVAQKMQAQAKVRPVDEDDYSDEDSEEDEGSEEDDDDDEEDYDDEEEEEEEEDEEDEEEEMAAQETMRRLKAKQQQPNGAMADMQQRLAALQSKQAALEEQKRRAQMAEHPKLMQQEAARRQQMPPPTLPASAMPLGLQMQMPMPGSVPMPSSMPMPGQSHLSMRRAQPQITYPNRRPSELDSIDDQFRASLRAMTPGPTGSSANRRPSLASSGASKATSDSHLGNTHITVGNSRENRRMSYMGSERRDQLEHMHTGFQQHQSKDIQSIITEAVQQQLQHLNLASRQPERVQFAMDDKLKNAMQYQASTDHVAHANRRDTLTDLPSIPLTEHALRRKTGLPSNTGSARSKRSEEEEASRISAGHRLTAGSESGAVTVNGDEMKVRIDTTNGFEMEFDGRLVVLNPIGDGTTAELIIGGKRETAYLSTRGSTATKSVIGRQPSLRERRNTRTEYEDDDDDRTERDRRTVYTREDRDRDRERDYREERRLRQERKERKERKEWQRQRQERLKPRRQPRYEEDDDDDDSIFDSYTSQDERRTQRPVRRRAKTYDDNTRRRAPTPDRRYKDDGAYHYPPNYGQRAGFSQQPQF